MAITFNDNIRLTAPKSLDSRYAVYESGATRAYNNTTEVLTTILPASRHIGLTVIVGTDEYWFKNGILDNNLVKKEVTVDTSSFVTKTGAPRQIITRATEFSGSSTLFITAANYASSGFNLLGNNISDGEVYRIDPSLFAIEGSYIKVSPSTPQIANISLNGTISNSKFQVQANGSTFWQKADDSFLFNIHPTNGLSAYGNTPFSFYGSTSQKMTISNDNTGLVITNTLNQAKLKLSDGGTLTLSQLPSNGPVGAPTLVRNPTTGNIELGTSTGGDFVDLTSNQSIGGIKSFSAIGNSSLNGTLDVSGGAIQNAGNISQVAFWDADGYLTTGTVPNPTLQNVLDSGNIALNKSIFLGDFYTDPITKQGVEIQATSGNTRIDNWYGIAKTATLELKASGIAMYFSGVANSTTISVGESVGWEVKDDLHEKGLGDFGDYSANKTDYSYVTKKWVLDQLVDIEEVSGTLEFRVGGITLMKLDSTGLRLKTGIEVYPNNFA